MKTLPSTYLYLVMLFFGSFTPLWGAERTVSLPAPLVHYRFDGDLSDASGNGWKGFYTPDGTAAAEPVFTSGVLDQALSLTSGADYMKIPGSESAFNFYMQGFAVSAWIKTQHTGSFGCLVAKQHRTQADGILGGWVFNKDSAGNIILGLRHQKKTSKATSTLSVTDGTWHFVTGVYDADLDLVTVLVDGEVAGQNKVNGALELVDTPVTIGTESEFVLNAQLDAELDEVKLWDRPLSPAQVRTLYQQIGAPATEEPGGDIPITYGQAHQDGRPKPNGPNIIYVMIDDAGYGDFSAFGSPVIKTPAMDRMCDEGIKFTHHYAGSAVCAPTRCVLMTGLHTGHCRRRDNTTKANKALASEPSRGLVFLEDEDLTVAETLREAGYVTGGIGKWGLGNPGYDGEPGKQGFDHWFGYLDQVHAHDHYTQELWQDGKMIPIPGNTGGKKESYVHDLFEEQTLAFIDAYRDHPFFLYLAYTLPHGGYVIPADDPAWALYKDQPWSDKNKTYAAMVTRVDESVGRLLDRLQEHGMDANTVVFYTSDNGPALSPSGFNSGGGLRGKKRSLYEGGIRAAMAVRWPGRIAAGLVSEFVWDMRDVFPTACDLAGIATPDGLDGMSVLPTLLGQEQDPHPYLYWEYHSGFQQAVRMGDWKAYRKDTSGPVELYDLSRDPGEKSNVASQHAALIAQMRQIMDSSHAPSLFWPVVTNGKRVSEP